MEEIDSILIYTLNQIGCDVGANLGELSPAQILKCVTKCFSKIQPELEIPPFDGNVSMSARYKIASQIAQNVSDLGYKDEIGCQSFLYPMEEETRKLLIFLIERLPKDDSNVADQIETLMSKIAQAQENESDNNNKNDEFSSEIMVDGIRLPSAVDIDKLPKETLKFYASHLADLTFAKEREKFKSNKSVVVAPSFSATTVEEDDDDNWDVEDEPEIIEKPQIKEKPKIAEKPKPKPPIKEKPSLDKNKEKEDAEKLAAEKLKLLLEETKEKVGSSKEKEKSIEKMTNNITYLEEEFQKLMKEFEEKEKILEKKRKTVQLINDSENGLEKVQNAISAQKSKMARLQEQWETLRKPILEKIQLKRDAKSNTNSEANKIKEEILYLKAQLKEMGQEARAKEELYNQLTSDYEKLPKDLYRSSYTKRILEIIGNIKKQKKEITKVIKDANDLQKDINTLTGKLDRTFAVADELLFAEAEKDKNVAQSYKILVAIHSDFSRMIKLSEDIGNFKRQYRVYEDKLEIERAKNVDRKLEGLNADLVQMKRENQILQAIIKQAVKDNKIKS